MKSLCIIFGLILIISCRKADVPISNLNSGKIEIYGHAGMGIEDQYPPNSYPSLIRALESDIDGVEMDIQMTKDSVLVIFKDEDLSSLTDCSGKVSEMNWSDLKQCRYHGLTPATSYPLANFASCRPILVI